MRGCVRKLDGVKTWQIIYELGVQAAQRCQAEGCGQRSWTGRKPLETCPKCGGELADVKERRQGSKAGFRTRKEAQIALNDILVSMGKGAYVEPSRMTVAEYLREWLAAIESTVRPSTFASYKAHVESYFEDLIGNVRLQDLSPSRINAAYGALQTKGGRQKKGVAPATVRRAHATSHRAMKDAVRWNKIPRNPVDSADPPKAGACASRQMKVWDHQQLGQFLDAVEGTRLYPLWYLLAATGLRRGEALGLRWDDVDLENGRLAIRQTLISIGYKTRFSEPKTKRGRRSIPLDSYTVTQLKNWHKAQLKERMKWRKAWTNTGLVFTMEDGLALHPDRVSKGFDEAIARIQKAQRKEAERRKINDPKVLPRIRLHDLRHTCATLALSDNIHPKVVSELLGHANISITLDTYSHALPGLAESAAERIGSAIARGRAAR